MSDMLYKDRIYEWRCTDSEISSFYASQTSETFPRCTKQEVAIGRLFTVMSASEYAFAAFAGLLLDEIGPKLTGVAGTLTAFCGWLLFASGSKAHHTYILGSVLLGGSSEMCFYPLLPAADLYPGRESTIMTIFGASRSLSMLIPLVMRVSTVQANVVSFRKAVLWFACIFTVSCFFVAALFIPWKAWMRRRDLLLAAKIKKKQEEEEYAPTGIITAKKREKIWRRCVRLPLVWIQNQKKKGSFIREMCTWSYGLMAIAYSCVVLAVMFFVPSTLRLIPEAYMANQVIQIFSFIPCPILGYAADRVGILWVMQFVNLCGFLTYFFTVVPKIPSYRVMQFAAAIFCAIQVRDHQLNAYFFAVSDE